MNTHKLCKRLGAEANNFCRAQLILKRLLQKITSHSFINSEYQISQEDPKVTKKILNTKQVKAHKILPVAKERFANNSFRIKTEQNKTTKEKKVYIISTDKNTIIVKSLLKGGKKEKKKGLLPSNSYYLKNNHFSFHIFGNLACYKCFL